MQHSPGFLKLVNETRPRVREITPDQARDFATSPIAGGPGPPEPSSSPPPGADPPAEAQPA